MQRTMPSQERVIIGQRYALLGHLATGGAGVVYEAEHLHTGARVALKLNKRGDSALGAATERLRNEARIVGSLASEHVVRILDADTRGDQPFLALELLRGRTLEAEAQTPMAPTRVLELLTQVAHGLERVHAAGYVHCDLKPENIFLTEREDGTLLVKLLDFGIAKHLGVEEGAARHAQFLGTPIYMSPEQAHGRRDLVDERSDTWALGMIAFRLLCGRSYFPEDTLQRMLLRLLFGGLHAPSRVGCGVSAAFDAWFLRSCSRHPAERFRSPREQLSALRKALSGVRRVHLCAAAYETGAHLALDCDAWSGGVLSDACSRDSSCPTAASHSLEEVPAVGLEGEGRVSRIVRRSLTQRGRSLLRALSVAAFPLLLLLRLFASRAAAS